MTLISHSILSVDLLLYNSSAYTLGILRIFSYYSGYYLVRIWHIRPHIEWVQIQLFQFGYWAMYLKCTYKVNIPEVVTESTHFNRNIGEKPIAFSIQPIQSTPRHSRRLQWKLVSPTRLAILYRFGGKSGQPGVIGLLSTCDMSPPSSQFIGDYDSMILPLQLELTWDE